MLQLPLWLYVVLAYALYSSVHHWKSLRELPDVPTFGHSGFLTCWKTAVEFIWNSPGVLDKGYELHRGRAFKIWTFSGWLVLVSGRSMVEDIRKSRKEQLSFTHIVEEQLQTFYTMGLRGTDKWDYYHVDVVRTTLTRNIAAKFEEMHDEVIACFADLIPASNEWTAIPALETSMKIVSRVGNRLMIGLPVCRNEEYIKLNIFFTVQVFKAAVIINLFPSFLRPIVGRVLSETKTSLKKGVRLLGPTIQARLDMDAKVGKENPDRPNDLISWLLDYEGLSDDRKTVSDLTLRILTINIAAEHTSSMTFTHALFDLASHPQLIPPLREEMERCIAAEGLTKKAMNGLHRLDSFMKESQRMYGLSSLALSRKVMTPFTFSNGITLPVGTNIGTPVIATHLDEDNYDGARDFRPFRFSDIREQGGNPSSFEHMVSPKPEYLPFGIGKHACPGRFMAETIIKLLLTYTLLNYDIKLEGESQERPKNMWVGHNMAPSTKAKVMFRKRTAKD